MNVSKLVKPLSYSALIIFLFLVPLFIKGPYQLHILIMAGIAVILASSLRLIFNSGQLSLGHGGMMSVGAYTSALLVMKLGLSTWAALGIGAAAAAALALMVGYPFVRLKGMYFALVTVFLAEVIRLIAEQWREVTGGSLGITNIPRPDPIVIPGLLNVDFASKADFYYLILVLVLVTLLILYAIERSSVNVTWLSIRQTDFLAESVGVNTARLKVIAFTIGCFFAGLSGAFFSQYILVITPSAFGFVYAIYVVVYMIAGGMKRFSGPIIGALILTFLPESARVLKEYQPFIFAGVLMLIIFFLPEGMVGLPQRLRNIVRERFSHA
jgi:branched-chain amino acid transport system permease protein